MSLDIAVLGQLVADKIISPEQFAWLLTSSPSNAQLILAGLEPLKPLNTGEPTTFAKARDALFIAQGGPATAASETKETIQDARKKDDEVIEVVAICIDVSGSMSTKFESDGQVDQHAINQNAKSIGRNRLEAVKQMFYGFRDQTCSFENGSRHRLGLISYDDKIKVLTPPTDKLDEFEAVIDKLQVGGSTAMYEAISEGCKMLRPLRAQYPRADLRVLCLSDGDNNCHKVSAEQALADLQSVEACVDFLLVGSTPDHKLLQLVQATEGECYQITTLSEGFDCLESKGVISLAARRNGAPKPQYKRVAVDLTQVAAAPLIRAGQPQQTQSSATVKVMDSAAVTQAISATTSNSNQKRILGEIRKFQETALDQQLFTIFPGATRSDGVIDFLKVLMPGPANTPYEAGVFELLLEFPSDYPFRPPRVTFVTPIYHYAVSAQGRICCSILLDSWSPNLFFFTALRSVRETLFEDKDPSCELSLRSWLSELKRVNPKEYANNAQQFTEQEAKESLADASTRILAGLPRPQSQTTSNVATAASPPPGSAGLQCLSPSQYSQLAVVSLASVVGSAAPSNAKEQRILADLKKLEEAKLGDCFQVFPGEQNTLGCAKVLMKGKQGTPYEGGVFELFLTFPPDYPFKAPSLRFVTPFFHFNVARDGAICCSVLLDGWSPSLSLVNLLSQVYADLMDENNPSEALRGDLLALRKADRTSYEQQAKAHMLQHARKGFEDLASSTSS